MNTDRNDEIDRDERELLDLLCAPARDDDEGGAAPAAEWSAVLSEIRSSEGEAAAPSSTFNKSLREAWETELRAARPTVSQRHRWWRLSIPLAAAAVIAFVLLWPGGVGDNNTGGSGVVWADVVRAMDRVQHFHIIMFNDDPRRADETMRMFRIDLFYQQPDRWRAHGMGHVAFSTGGKRQTWSAAKHAFLENVKGERVPDLLPAPFIDVHGKLGTLAGILSSVFDGKVPEGEPVKSDDVASAQGIDVFDYARNAREKWVRIWVLRESKLPLKMHLYYPGSDEFMLVTFDYSDPQPDAFFDAEAFARQASKLQGEDPYRAYSIGSAPVAGTRPRAADQIHAIEGGYRAPKVRRVLSNELGDIVVVTDNPTNRTPTGAHPGQQGYQRVTDTWGNRYVSFDGQSGTRQEDDRRTCLMPIPPFKRGTDPRRLILTWVIDAGSKETTFGPDTIDVSDPSAAGKPQDWPKDLAAQKHAAWRGFIQRFGTLAQQLAEIDGILIGNPQDLSTLSWKLQLLREHGREVEAWILFETDMRDRIFSDPKVLNERYVEASQYLLYLADEGRDEELKRLSDVSRKAMEAARAVKDPRGASKVYNLKRAEHNPLYTAAHVIDWREAYKDGPRVVRTVAGRDGLVFIELQVPKPPDGWASNGWDGSAPMGWFWQPTFGDAWHVQARLVRQEQGTLRIVLRGDGKQVALSGEASLASDNYGSSKPKRHDARIQWQRTIDVPAPTVESVKVFWIAENGGKADGWRPDPPPAGNAAPVAKPDGPHEWMNAAAKLRDDGKFAAALELYGKALAAPHGAWPTWYTQGVGLVQLVEQSKWQIRVAQAQCLAELGRFDDARRVAAELWAMLPQKPDLTDPVQGHIAAEAVAAELHVPRVMLGRGDAKGAVVELERIAQRRPNLPDFPEATVMVDRGPAKFGWDPRSKQKDAWREFDSVWWDVRDAAK
ncbi:MAG: hypothetical protein WBD40_08770 [Tepidisphaeraceae bacterium]